MHSRCSGPRVRTKARLPNKINEVSTATQYSQWSIAFHSNMSDPVYDAAVARYNAMHYNESNKCDEAGGYAYDYKPPQRSYAEQQSQVVEDSVRTYIRAENSASNVLLTLQMQRQQLQKANDDTWKIRSNAIKAQQQLKELQHKAWKKKQCLYAVIVMLSFVDYILFARIVHCGGGFFCRQS